MRTALLAATALLTAIATTPAHARCTGKERCLDFTNRPPPAEIATVPLQCRVEWTQSASADSGHGSWYGKHEVYLLIDQAERFNARHKGEKIYSVVCR